MPFASETAERDFRPVPLGTETMHRAYPLLRLARPDVSLREWLAFARRVVRQSPRRAGYVTLCDTRGYVHALFRYGVEPALAHGRLLRVTDVAVARLPGGELDTALLEAAEGLAASLGCTAITLEMTGAPLPSEVLVGAGFRNGITVHTRFRNLPALDGTTAKERVAPKPGLVAPA